MSVDLNDFRFWFIVFLVVNALVALFVFVIGLMLKKVNRRLLVIRCLIILMAPGVAPTMFLLSWMFHTIFFKKEVDLSDVVFSKEKSKELFRIDEERERNFVPLEEAIAVADNSELRELVMGVAQGDYSNSLASIYLALNCEDTETAHYAASVLQDALNDYRLIVQKEFKRLRETAPNPDAEIGPTDEEREQRVQEMDDLLDYINKVLEQKIFEPIEQVSFTGIMDSVMELFYSENPQKVSSEHFENVCLRLIDIKDFDNCKKWCDRALVSYPNTLSTYTTRIKMYFNSGERDKFFAAMEELKQSSLIIDKETLELIRTFL